MVSKNNRIKKMEKAAERKPHFAIRKLTIGAASVLLGTTLWMSTTASTSHADTNDDANSPESHEKSNTTADNGTGDANKTVVITNNDAAKAAADATTDNVTINNNESTETKAAQDKNSSNSVSEKKSTETKSSVDTSSLEKSNVSASTVTTDKSTQASAANKASNNVATTTNKVANASTTTNKSASTTVNNTEKAAAKLAEDANVNTGNITKSTVSKDTTITDAGKVGKQDQNNVDTQTFNLNTAELGKLTKSSDSHFNPKLAAALFGNSLIQANANNAVNANTSALNSSALTNGDASALGASLRAASGNNDTSNYQTVTNWSGLKGAVNSSASGVIISGTINVPQFTTVNQNNDLNINKDFTIIGADENATLNLNNNVINNNGNLTLKNINIKGAVAGNGTVNIEGKVTSTVGSDNSIIKGKTIDEANAAVQDQTSTGKIGTQGTSWVAGSNNRNGWTVKGWNYANFSGSNVNIAADANLTISRSAIGDGIHLTNNGTVNVADNGQLTINMNTNNDLNTTARYHNAGIFAVGNGNFTTGYKSVVTLNTSIGQGISMTGMRPYVTDDDRFGGYGARDRSDGSGQINLGQYSTLNFTGRDGVILGNNSHFNVGDSANVHFENKGRGVALDLAANSDINIGDHAVTYFHSVGKNNIDALGRNAGVASGSYDGYNYIGVNEGGNITVGQFATFRVILEGRGDNAWDDVVSLDSRDVNTNAAFTSKTGATIDIRDDNTNFYAELISFPLGASQSRIDIHDPLLLNLQRYSSGGATTGWMATGGDKINTTSSQYTSNLIYMSGANGEFSVDGTNYVVYQRIKSDGSKQIWLNVNGVNIPMNGFQTKNIWDNKANPDVSINGNGLTGGVRANQVHNYYGSPLIGKDAPYYGISTQRASHQIWFPHQTTMEVTGTHTNTIKYVYSDGTPVTDANGNPIVKTQDITLTRKLTLDISQDKIEDIQNYALSHTSDETLEYIKNAQAVTADSGWTYTDAQGNKITSPYAEVVSPTVKGYTATIQSSNVPGIKKGADGSSVTAKLQFKEDLVQNGEISSDYKAQGISAIIPDNYETVVVYSVPQDVKDTLKFYDDATKSYITDAPDQTAIGKENDTVNFKDGASTVKSLEDKGYKFVNVTDGTPDDTKATILTGNSFDKVDFGKFGKSGKTFVVHLTHKVIPVTPYTPNIPSNSKITKDDLTKTATRTIHYVENGQNGAALKDSTVQTVTYSGTAYIDEVTGQMVNAKADGKDSQGNTTYVVDPDNKTTPSITWTTSNNGKFAQVTPDATINKDGQNWNTTVKSVNEENAPEVSKITGKTTNEDVYVPYTLQQKTYTGVDENKTVTRTIKYLDNETKEEIKGLDPVTQTTNLHRTQIKDEKGNVVGYGTISADGHSYTINNNWIIDNNGWSAQVSPDATGLGYKKTPHFDNGQDASTVPAGTVSVTDPQDKTVKVYYDHDYEPVTPDHPHDGVDPSEYTKDVNETVHYVYSDGTKAADDNVQTSKWSRTLTVDKVTGQLVPNGQYTTEWAIAKGQPSEYSQVNSPVIKGYYANQANVPATKVTQDDIEKTVTYKPLGHIIPVDPTTGDPIPNAPQPQFPNNPTDPTKGNPGEKPTVPGYHPQDGKPGEPVSPVPGNPGEDVKVPYVKDQGTVSVIFHDDTTNSTIPNVGFNSGDAAADTPVTYNPEKNISDLEKQGYVYVRTEGTLPGKVEANKNITVTVHMKHGVQPVTPTTPPTDVPKNTPKEAQPDQLTKKVNLTVNYVNADGTTFNGNVPANAKQTATFTGTAYVDKITGQLVNAKQEDGKWVINTDDTATPEITWTSDKTSFEGVTSPAEKGYHVSNVSSHADGDNVAAITGLTKDSQDITVTVTYAKNGTKIVGERTVEGSMTVHYTGAGDLTPKDNVQSGVNFHYTGDVHDAETNELVSKGHWEVNGVTGDSYQFNEVDSPAVSGYTAEVKVVPGFKATPDKPTFETTVNYTKNGTEIQNKKNVPASQTVQYVDDQGNVLRPEVKQNSEFQYSGDTVDKVTGETIKPGSWNETTHNFTAENVPVIKGYVAVSGYTNNNGKYTAGGFTATNTGSKEDNNKVFKVVYKKVGNLVPQDPNGNPIPDPKNPGQNVPNVPYTNDPTDPTKVTPNEKTPDIPGWHTDTPNVTPTDPTKDTPVVYTKNVENQNVTVKYFDDTKETDLSSYDKSISAKPGEALNYSTQPSITELENKGYKLVSDNFNVTTMPEKGENYEVHFVHKTTTITPGKPGKPGEPINPNDPNGPKWPTGTDAKALTKQSNQTVHYVYADGTKAADDNVQNTTFAHTLVFDNVTGKQIEDKGWTPESHTFKDVTSPEIDGYHADKKTVAGATVTVNDPTSETTVIYAKNDTEIRNHQEVTASQLVKYVDEDGNELRASKNQNFTFTYTGDTYDKETGKQIATGKWNQTSTDFTSENVPVIDGYVAVKGYTRDDNDKVVAGGFTTSYDASDAKRNRTFTVVYKKVGKIVPVDPSKNPIPDAPTPSYENDPTDPTKVTPDEPTPNVPGYTPSQNTVTPPDPTKDTPVVYTKNVEQKAKVQYIDLDDNNKVMSESPVLTGQAGDKIDYSTTNEIANYEKQGYVLADDGFSNNPVFDNVEGNEQIFKVTFHHGQIPVNPDHPHDGVDPSKYTKDVKETVHYVDTEGNKVHDDNVQTSKWTRTLTVDAVTGKTIDNGQYTTDWSIAKGEKTVYDQVNTPVVDGYHADKREVPATAVTQDNIDVTVIYAKNGKIIPTDPSGKPIPNVPTPTYPTDPTDPTKVTPDEPVPDIPGLIPSKPTVTPTDPGKDTPVPYNPVIPAKDQAAVVNYIDSDEGNKVITTSGNLSGKAGSTIDYSTKSTIADLENKGYVLVNDGFPAGAKFDSDDNTTQIFTVVLKHGTVPVTPDKPGKPGEPINPNDPDGPKWPEGTDENSVKKTGTQTIHYVGAGENTPKDDVQTFDFTKKMVVDKVTGKIIDSGEWNVTSHTFGYKDTPVIDGYHADKRNAGGSVVTPDDLNKTVTVTYTQNGKIIPTDPSGKPIPNVPNPTYPTDPTDPTKVTPDEPVPDIPGMIPSKPTVTPTDPGKDTPVPYTPVTPVVNTVTGKITYIDDDATGNKILDVDNFSGKVGDKIDYTTAGEIQSYVNKGYVLVSNNFKDGDETFAKDGNVFEVHFKHGTTTVTPEKPGKPGEPIDPSNPEGPKYPAGTDEHAVKRTGTQTVHFTGAGDKTPADKKQSFDFTRKITFDNVTGKIITTTPWNEASHTFGYENVPVVDGFHTTVKTAGGTTVTPDDLDKTVTVNYSQNGKIIPVDPSGKPIPNAPTPTYPTDPTDPTKVVPNEPVPNIPGMVPSKNTVTPSDPGKDTPVIYNNGNTPVNPDTPTTPTNPTTPTTPTTPDEPTNVTPHAETPETPSEPEKPSDDTNTVKPHAGVVPTSKKKSTTTTKTVTPHAQREVRITKNGNIINSKGHTIGYVDDKGQVHKTLPQTGDSAELAEAEAILGGIAAGLGLIGLAGSKKRRRN